MRTELQKAPAIEGVSLHRLSHAAVMQAPPYSPLACQFRALPEVALPQNR
jgi:hypothetical protein